MPLQATDTIFTKVQEQLMRGQLEVEEWKAALETGEALTTAYKYGMMYRLLLYRRLKN